MRTNKPPIPTSEQISIARGDSVNHPKISEMVREGNPFLLNLIIFNRNTHDDLKLKALKKIADPDNQDFDLKTKKSLVTHCIKESNFGNQHFFEAKQLLAAIREDQLELTSQIIKEHIQYVINRQGALSDPDFKIITSEIDLLINAFRSQVGIGKWIASPALWNYIRMVKWAQYLEDDVEINLSLNNSLLAELEPILALDEWEHLDEVYGDPKNTDTLIYCTFHKVALDLHHNVDEIIRQIEKANEVIENFDDLVQRAEQLILESHRQKTERDAQQRQEIQKRIMLRKERDSQRHHSIKSSRLEYVGDASINNRWP